MNDRSKVEIRTIGEYFNDGTDDNLETAISNFKEQQEFSKSWNEHDQIEYREKLKRMNIGRKGLTVVFGNKVGSFKRTIPLEELNNRIMKSHEETIDQIKSLNDDDQTRKLLEEKKGGRKHISKSVENNFKLFRNISTYSDKEISQFNYDQYLKKKKHIHAREKNRGETNPNRMFYKNLNESKKRNKKYSHQQKNDGEIQISEALDQSKKHQQPVLQLAWRRKNKKKNVVVEILERKTRPATSVGYYRAKLLSQGDFQPSKIDKDFFMTQITQPLDENQSINTKKTNSRSNVEEDIIDDHHITYNDKSENTLRVMRKQANNLKVLQKMTDSQNYRSSVSMKKILKFPFEEIQLSNKRVERARKGRNIVSDYDGEIDIGSLFPKFTIFTHTKSSRYNKKKPPGNGKDDEEEDFSEEEILSPISQRRIDLEDEKAFEKEFSDQNLELERQKLLRTEFKILALDTKFQTQMKKIQNVNMRIPDDLDQLNEKYPSISSPYNQRMNNLHHNGTFLLPGGNRFNVNSEHDESNKSYLGVNTSRSNVSSTYTHSARSSVKNNRTLSTHKRVGGNNNSSQVSSYRVNNTNANFHSPTTRSKYRIENTNKTKSSKSKKSSPMSQKTKKFKIKNYDWKQEFLQTQVEKQQELLESLKERAKDRSLVYKNHQYLGKIIKKTLKTAKNWKTTNISNSPSREVKNSSKRGPKKKKDLWTSSREELDRKYYEVEDMLIFYTLLERYCEKRRLPKNDEQLQFLNSIRNDLIARKKLTQNMFYECLSVELLRDNIDTFNLIQFIRTKLNIEISELFLFIEDMDWNKLSVEFEKLRKTWKKNDMDVVDVKIL